jgi:hypothetical protein
MRWTADRYAMVLCGRRIPGLRPIGHVGAQRSRAYSGMTWTATPQEPHRTTPQEPHRKRPDRPDTVHRTTTRPCFDFAEPLGRSRRSCSCTAPSHRLRDGTGCPARCSRTATRRRRRRSACFGGRRRGDRAVDAGFDPRETRSSWDTPTAVRYYQRRQRPQQRPRTGLDRAAARRSPIHSRLHPPLRQASVSRAKKPLHSTRCRSLGLPTTSKMRAFLRLNWA